MTKTSIKVSLTTFKDLHNHFPNELKCMIKNIILEIETRKCNLIVYEEFDVNTFRRETPVAQFLKSEDFYNWIDKNYPFN